MNTGAAMTQIAARLVRPRLAGTNLSGLARSPVGVLGAAPQIILSQPADNAIHDPTLRGVEFYRRAGLDPGQDRDVLVLRRPKRPVGQQLQFRIREFCPHIVFTVDRTFCSTSGWSCLRRFTNQSPKATSNVPSSLGAGEPTSRSKNALP